MFHDDAFLVIYPLVPLIGLFGYIPQIITLSQTKHAPRSLSLPTWITWTVTWFISFGYAYFYVNDLLLSTTSAMNLAGHLLVIGLALYKRARYTVRSNTKMPETGCVKPGQITKNP